jgi:hypothetical protein
MAGRQWYIGRGDKPDGPYSDARLRQLIAAGSVTADTLVWCAGMSAWARAADIPGLMPAARRTVSAASVPSIQPVGAPQDGATGALALNVRVWPLFWRGVVTGLSELAVIPFPWMAAFFLRWLVDYVELPAGQRVSFVGKPEDVWWVFMLYALCGLSGLLHSFLQLAVVPLTTFLLLLMTRWFFANLAWSGQKAALRFTGGYWALLGWTALFFVSVFSIVGWAWVATAWARWGCRNVQGSARQLVFNGSGWGYLWRTLVVAVTAIFLIPLPWTTRWLTRWLVSQLALIERA